jgi:glycine amidinotransferase
VASENPAAFGTLADAKGKAARVTSTSKNLLPIVNSYNEWDPLEEVVLGVVDGACVPGWDVALEATMPPEQRDFYLKFGGCPFPQEKIAAANQDLKEFAHILEAEGVIVRRPQALDHARGFGTPEWESQGGLYGAMPRDGLLVIGEEIIEAPMAWRSRYFEMNAYRPLLKYYFQHGARWTAAPKPQLSDELYNPAYAETAEGEEMRYAITEFEPTFDAADFIRCGRDIFVQQSHVTNSFGIEWLRRHLGERYTIHELSFNDRHPMHIDATIMPLAPGKLLVNPERVRQLPSIFRDWEVLTAPPSLIPDGHTLYMTSKWIHINVLMLDEKRVVVERHEEPLIAALRDWGFDPIPCSFRSFNSFGGAFHCATLDIRRRGALQSYF